MNGADMNGSHEPHDHYHRYLPQQQSSHYDSQSDKDYGSYHSQSQSTSNNPVDHYYDDVRSNGHQSMDQTVRHVGPFSKQTSDPDMLRYLEYKEKFAATGGAHDMDSPHDMGLHHSDHESNYGKTSTYGKPLSSQSENRPYSSNMFADDQPMMHGQSSDYGSSGMSMNEPQGSMGPSMNSQMGSSMASSMETPMGSPMGSAMGPPMGPPMGAPSSSDNDMQSLMNQFSNQNSMVMGKPNEPPQMDYPTPNMNDFAQFQGNPMPNPLSTQSQMSDVGGIAGFQPAPEGNQLPAPPGYKHVGYITIPAGAANLPNMVSQPNNGLPMIRPVPINGAPDMSKLTGLKGGKDGKKIHDQKVSESKPVRSFLSRLNPLNMLRRLRQRRERRQTNDMPSSDYIPNMGSSSSAKYSNYGSYGQSSMASSYPMSPYAASGYGSISGMGGISGLGAMYSNPSAMYGPAGYGSYGYSGYPGYGYMPQASSPYMPVTGGMGDMKTGATPSGNDMAVSASAMSPQTASSPHMPMSPMGMMMPMNMPMGSMGGMAPMGGMGGMGPMGGMAGMSGYPGYPGMGAMPMSSMPMPYGFGGPHGSMPGPQSSSSSGGSSSESSGSNGSGGDQSNPLGGQTQLPGGLNLADLLKDEEDEPSRFRKFLGYLNPMNMFRRFRNNTSEERKRLGRFKREVPMYLVHVNGKKAQMKEQKDKASKSNDSSDTSADFNLTFSKADNDDATDDMVAHDSIPSVSHGRRKSSKRSKYSLMGSRNFEILRGGTFQSDSEQSSSPIVSTDTNDYDSTSTSLNGAANVLSELDDDMYDTDAPEILGFQGFNGFGSNLNTLSASNDSPNYVEMKKSGSMTSSVVHESAHKSGEKPFASIENAAITNSDLKAIS